LKRQSFSFRVLFSELSPVQRYIDECMPALWEVSRAGHNWVTYEERINAFLNLVEWIRYGTFITARYKNTTIPAKDPPRESMMNEHKTSVVCQVRSINIHGDPKLNLTRLDLEDLEMILGSQIKFVVDNKEEEYIATFDKYPFVRAAPDSWVIMLDPMNYLCLWKRTWQYLLKLEKNTEIRFIKMLRTLNR
jgi:hypothetical protein